MSDKIFISEWQANEEKEKLGNVFELSGYLRLPSIREITGSIYATSTEELSL